LLARPLRLLRLALPLVGLAAPIASAAAHPRLEKSAPAAESRLAAPPKQVTLTFNESLDLALTRVTLLRGTEPVRLDSLRLTPGDDRTVIATIPSTLAPGRYTVKWQVTGDDGHPVRGEFAFEVLAAGTASTSVTPPRPRR
jgi:methionine-rich copper-binding protein CopC